MTKISGQFQDNFEISGIQDNWEPWQLHNASNELTLDT